MEERGYKKLVVWQKADELAYEIYIETKSFSKHEIYGLTSQLRRAGLSVSTNLVEGVSRQNKGELRQFVNISMGSLAEVEYLLDFSLKLEYIKEKQHKKLQELQGDVSRLLWRFYSSI